MATRIAGVIRLLSKEYFTRNTIPRKRTNPPIQAKSLTPKNASQSNGFDGTGGGGGGGGDTRGGTSRNGGGGDGGAGAGGGAPRGGTEGGAGGYFTSGGGVGTVAARGSGSRERTDSLGAGAVPSVDRDSRSATRLTRFRKAPLSLWISITVKTSRMS